MLRCRDLTAELLHEVCYDVGTEPQLNPVTGETFSHKTANTTDDASVDVSARGFWVRGQKAFFDVRIFDPTAKSYSAQILSAAHTRNENEKKRSYNHRILQIEHGTFTPLIFTRECQKFYSRLSEIISDKRMVKSIPRHKLGQNENKFQYCTIIGNLCKRITITQT